MKSDACTRCGSQWQERGRRDDGRRRTLSAMAYTVDWMCAPTWSGITDASTTRRFSVPYTISVLGSTTPAVVAAAAV